MHRGNIGHDSCEGYGRLWCSVLLRGFTRKKAYFWALCCGIWLGFGANLSLVYTFSWICISLSVSVEMAGLVGRLG